MKLTAIPTILSVFMGLSASFLGQIAAAETADQTIVVNGQSVSLKPAVDYYAKLVKTIDKPVYLWSWLNKHSGKKFGDVVNDPNAARAYMKETANGYWQDLCTHNLNLDPADCDQSFTIFNQENFGHGLYLARDPVITVRYGGGAGWNLLQLQLPAGLRYFDLRLDGVRDDMPPAVVKLLHDVGCPNVWDGGENFTLIRLMSFANPNFGTNPVCNLALRKVFKEALHIDGFFYPYMATAFNTCTTPTTDKSIPGEAFVLADDAKITNFSVFNAQSTKQKEDRVRIESFFYKASAEDFHMNFDRFLQHYDFKDHPGYSLRKNTSYYNCLENGGCVWSGIWLFKTDNDVLTDIAYPETPLFPFPATISQTNVPYSQGDNLSQSLMWKDLDGAPTDAHLDEWMKANFFKCN